MGRVGHVLWAAATTAACAGQPQPAPPVLVRAPSHPAPPTSLAVPDEALGAYFVEGGPFVALAEVNGRLFFVWPQSAAALNVAKSPRGFTLTPTAPAPLSPDEDERNTADRSLPATFELLPPASNQGWRLEPNGEETFAQRPNPWARRLTRGRESLELERRDLRGLEQQAQISRYLHLVRDQPADDLLKLTQNVDPELIQAKGGIVAYLAEQLCVELEELRPVVKPDEVSKFAHYIEITKAVAYAKGALWAASEDGFLDTLTERLSHTHDKVVLGPGSLMRVDTRDVKGVAGCELGVMVPDPSENGGHEWAPFKPPGAGKISGFSHVVFVLQSGPPGSCEKLRPSQYAYPVRHGAYFVRLFADAQAQIRGAQFMGYMASQIAVSAGASNAELRHMLRANNEELSHQAE